MNAFLVVTLTLVGSDAPDGFRLYSKAHSRAVGLRHNIIMAGASQRHNSTSRSLAITHQSLQTEGSTEDNKTHDNCDSDPSPKQEAPGGTSKVANKEEFWSDHCYGYWEPWTPCAEDCYKSKRLVLIEDRCDSFGSFKNESIVYKFCMKDDCKVTRWAPSFMKAIRQGIFAHGFHSGLMESLGNAIGQTQVLITAMLLTVVVVLTLVQSLRQDWLPDITIVIPVAAAFAMIVRFAGFGGVTFGPAANTIFGVTITRMMNDFLIPISLFEGAYHIQRKNFWAELVYGIILAVIGTAFSAFMIAPMVKFSGQMGFHTVKDWRQSFAYAAFIADVDPVATLSIFGKLKTDPLLQTLVAGEATLNDPIALVIFGICNERAKDVDVQWGLQIWNGVVLLAGSIVIGLVAGLILSFGLIIFRVRGKGALETCYIFLSAYVCFSVGESLRFSGIIVALFAGLIMGIYASDSVEDGDSVDSFLVNAARLADMIMFMIIGFSFFLVDDMQGVKLGLLTIPFCLVSRAIMISTLVPFINYLKRMRGHPTINTGTTFMMFHSGLRGGMTMMMALMVDPYWAKQQNTLVVATVVCVTGMAYLCGCTGPFFLKLTGVPVGVPQQDGSLARDESKSRTFLKLLDERIRIFVGPPKQQKSANEQGEDNITEDGGDGLNMNSGKWF